LYIFVLTLIFYLCNPTTDLLAQNYNYERFTEADFVRTFNLIGFQLNFMSDGYTRISV